MTPATSALLTILMAAPAAAVGASPAAAPARVVRCEGLAAPRLAEEPANVSVTRLRTGRAARTQAVRACVAAIRALSLGTGTVGDRLDRDPPLARAVERVVRRARPDDAPQLFADGGVSVRLAVPLDGELARLVAGAAEWPVSGGVPAEGRPP